MIIACYRSNGVFPVDLFLHTKKTLNVINTLSGLTGTYSMPDFFLIIPEAGCGCFTAASLSGLKEHVLLLKCEKFRSHMERLNYTIKF